MTGRDLKVYHTGSTADHEAVMVELLAEVSEREEIEALYTSRNLSLFSGRTSQVSQSQDDGSVVQFLPGSFASELFGSLSPSTTSTVTGGAALSGWDATPLQPSRGQEIFAGVPVGSQGPIWYYNKQLFRRAGLDAERAPTTWEELRTAAQTLKRAGIQPIGQSGADSVLLWWAWNSLSPQYFSADECRMIVSGQTSILDPRFLESLEVLRGLYLDDLINRGSADLGMADVGRLFAAGEIAIIPGIISLLMNWREWDRTLGPNAYGVFTAPAIDGKPLCGQSLGPTFVYGFIGDSIRREARRAVELIASIEGQSKLLAGAGQFPNRTDIDVHAVSLSVGARSIRAIIERVGAVDDFGGFFSQSTQHLACELLTDAMQTGNLVGLLERLDASQRAVTA